MVIGFYGHPEYYPPVLNALTYLSEAYDKIFVVHRNYPSLNWQYPPNVELISNGLPAAIIDVTQASTATKIKMFLRFCIKLFKVIKKNKADTILLYDSIPVLAYWLVRPFLSSSRVIWYHNHDITDPLTVKKYSIGWWSVQAERWIFPSLNIFTLPSEARKSYFPTDTLKGSYFFLPNFPSMQLYGKYAVPRQKPVKTVNLTYQGFLGRGHGLEEIIQFILTNKKNYSYCLFLKGFISEEYRETLLSLAHEHSVQDQVVFEGFLPYAQLPDSNLNNHIGIAIYKGTDVMNTTIATASNKIYEYAAQGMPVLVYDNVYFRSNLQSFEWVFFTDCSASSLQDCLDEIVIRYELYSKQSTEDFRKKLNFEYYCQPVMDKLVMIK